ncbi:MAG: hypothetical protein WDZ59_08730 [Pirellulales bacterium]
MTSAQSLTFHWTGWSIAFALVVMAITAALCLIAWRRSGRTVGTGLMETLRLTIVALSLVTLLQPEWLVQYLPDERPTIVVLADSSGSMQTRDVIDENRPSEPPVTRRESIAPLLAESLWAPFADRFDVVVEDFSSSLADPEQGTDLHAALSAAASRHDNLRGVVLLSDGDWNTGDPPVRAASELRTKSVPVFAAVAGSESRLPDLELVRVDAPTFGVVGKPLRIPLVVSSALPRDATVNVTLTPSEGEPVTEQFTVPAMGQLADAMLWTPQEKGEFELTVNVPAHEEEFVTENNERTVPISIREEALRVLLVESFPRWEYRYLRNALERDPGVQVSCLLFHPELKKVGGGKGYIEAFPDTMEALSKYDVVFLGDVGVEPGQLTVEDCRLIKGLVQSQASGLVFMPGMRGAHLSLIGTELEELYPVVLDAAQPRGWGSRIAAQMELTAAGRRSLLTQLEDTEDTNARLWETLPGFQWYAAVERAKAGAEVLACHKTQSGPFGRLPLLVTRTYGTGKILFIGTDGAWRWREGVEDRYHYRFWGQVTRWMAYRRGMAHGELMRLFYSPDRPQSGDTVTLHANISGTGGEPLREGTAVVQIVSPSGESDSVRLSPSDEWGLFTGTFTPDESGTYQLRLTCRENGSTLDATLSVQDVERERLGQPARLDVLEELTALTGGKIAKTGDVQGLLQEISDLPEPEPLVRRLRIWSHPAWAGSLVFLLGLFWIVRKAVGVI